MKKILFIINSLTAGGAETFLMKMSRALPAEEYRFDFIVCDQGGVYTQEILDRGGRIYYMPKRTENLPGALRSIADAVRQDCYDCVLKLGNPPIGVLDLIAAKAGGAKRVGMRSCNAPTGLSLKSRCMDALLRPVLNLVCDVRLAPSMLAAEYTFGRRAAHSNVHLIQNAVDLSFFRFHEEGRRAVRKEFGLQDRLIVGHIGRFHTQKNHMYLLEVFRAIRQRNADAALLLIGTGELEPRVRARVRELGMEDAVIFAGTRFDVPQLLSAMDVFVFPSLYEGMPNTVIEAQATGLPCVLSDTITPEADLTGLLTYLSLDASAEQWAECALSAAQDPRRDTSRDLAAKGYDVRTAAKHFADLLCPDEP